MKMAFAFSGFALALVAAISLSPMIATAAPVTGVTGSQVLSQKSPGLQASAAAATPTCLGEVSIPKLVDVNRDSTDVQTTVTLKCKGNYSGITDRLSLQAEYGGGWQTIATSSGAIGANGSLTVSTHYLCGGGSYKWRGYAQLFNNGIPSGVNNPSSAATLECAP